MRKTDILSPQLVETAIFGVLDSASAPVLAVNGTGNFTYQNRAAEGMLGYQRHELTCLSIEDLTFNADWVRPQFERLKQRQAWSGRLLMRRASGEAVAVALNALVGISPQGDVHYVSLLHQIMEFDAQTMGPLYAGSDEGLTPHELGVLSLLAEGFADKEIATLLGVSVWSVNRYVHMLLQKLQVRSRTEACVFALKNRLIV